MATLSGHGSGSPTERLPDPATLACWLHAAGLTRQPVGATAADLADARSLREALFAVVGAATHDRDVPPPAVNELNRVAERPAATPRLVVVAGELRALSAELDAPAALAVVARDAIDLLGGPERTLLRECEADDCSGIYVDRSRGGRRRWCSTARCGNRARVAAHRARFRPAVTRQRRG